MPNLVILSPKETPSLVYLAKKDKRLSKLFDVVGPISYKPHTNGYSFLVTTIIGQMLANKVANALRQRMVTLCHGKITPQHVNKLTNDEIKSIGISSSKVSYIRLLTNTILNNKSLLKDLKNMSDEDVLDSLTSLKGIGSWSAKMYLIFVLDRQNILPYEDFAFQQGYMWLYKAKSFSKLTIAKRCQKWKPFTSIAARFLYRAVDNGLTKTPFHL